MVLDHEVSNSSQPSAITTIDDYRGNYKSPLGEAIEKALVWSQNTFGTQEIIDAKNSFYQLTGKFFPEDDFYLNRISYFIDYFLFERTIKNKTTPFALYTEKQPSIITEAIHNIFVVQKVNDSSLSLKSLVHQEKYRISSHQGERFDGILKGDLIQGFIYKIENSFHLSRSLLFHPHKGAKYIKKKIKKGSRAEHFNTSEMLYELARTQMKHLRHDHVSPKVFYAAICQTLSQR